MKQLELRGFGEPAEAVACVEVPEPAPPARGEVLVRMVACPINPADLLIVEGRYATRPPLPAPLGIEGAGEVLALGDGVEDLVAGDLVLSLARANWVERICVPAEQLIRVPRGLDPLQVAMLKVNPATALMMLRDYVALDAGQWLVQNAANSAVGRCVIRLARAAGLRSVAVVRRDSLGEELLALGADTVVTDGDDLAGRVRAATGGADLRLAIDAVAGPASDRLAACLADGATLVNYGLLSGVPCHIAPARLVFHDLRVRGFWLARTMRGMQPAAVITLYQELAARLADGTLGVPLEATYPLERCAEALAHAARPGRAGKVLLVGR